MSNGARSILFIDDDNGDWGVTSIVVDTVRNVNTIPGKGRLQETTRPNLVSVVIFTELDMLIYMNVETFILKTQSFAVDF